MRITRPHHLATIFKNLHIGKRGMSTQFLMLFDPYVDHAANLGQRHACESEIMLRRKTNYTANSRLAMLDKQALFAATFFNQIGNERGIVIVENQCSVVVGIASSGGPSVSGTHIARRIVRRLAYNTCRLNLPLPGSLRPLRRNQLPLPGKRIEAPVSVAFEIKCRHERFFSSEEN